MILVTGGTGLIGSHLLFHLIKNGKTVRATYRNEDTLNKVSKVFGYYSDDPSSLMKHIDWVKGDITNIGELETSFEGINYVYHCAALISFDPKQYKALAKINVDGTANVVNLCLKHGIKKLCYVSSIAAIGPSVKGDVVTEENEWNDTHASVYGITKHDAELEVWRASQEGLPVVIVNPGVVIGPGFWRSGSGTFFTYAAKGKKSFIPGGTGFVTINDVVSAMTTLMASHIAQEQFIMVSQNLSYGELFQKIAPKLDVEPPTKKIPFWMLEFFWRLDWLRSNLRGKRRRLTKTMTKGLYKREHYSSEKLIETLDFTFEDLDAAIAFCCAKFKA
ncbi:NAD-dependent epimerase/dehydratase family protein [Muricauda sp. CAU 1633]|uniref:NAD-dependent epimerase/dehydratase family protein n=1 Tax=Allomuricauda sp. CAU 1633 TaxID=2816036 RepID=UPI001A8F6433|nr:NAD-dependent epimerase/dehydratase family protein [Muricauda sp. CAU 1633]MBO0321334.1 NAD-dependent epimerase/dehydratase family protein [Muricauda sp. CAU 1633]